MKEKLRSHIDSLFAEAPATRRATELKEELYANLAAKYDDMLASGASEEDAFKAAAASIGDVSELIAALRRESVLDPVASQAERRRSGLIIASAVGLYILSIAALILCALIDPDTGGEIGVVVMFVFVAAATALLVYNGIVHGSYHKRDSTIVEDFKEWKSGTDSRKKLRKAVSSILWPITVVVYLIYSWVFMAWAYSWILFLIAVAIERIIYVVIDSRE